MCLSAKLWGAVKLWGGLQRGIPATAVKERTPEMAWFPISVPLNSSIVGQEGPVGKGEGHSSPQ